MADNFKYAQLQNFSLAGSGCVVGDTSIVLKSMTDIDGNALTMSLSFGAIAFATLEPGNGQFEEQICFTGLTNNTNGTVTLTGISNVSFLYPYTQTPGVAKTHAGSTTLVISNTSGFYDELTAKNDDETITGTYTFTNPKYPRMDVATPYPTDAEQLATKGYVDSLVFAGAPNASTTVKGIVQEATQSQTDSKTTSGSTGAELYLNPGTQRSTLQSDYVADTGTANVYVIAPSPAISAYTVGQIFTFKATHTNTLTSTLNINGLGAKTIKKLDGATSLVAGDIVIGQIIEVQYDGTNFQMTSPSANGTPAVTSSNINEFVTSTDGSTLSFGRPFNYQAFTTNGTWTKPSNLSGNEFVLVQLWGGGGGGGGVGSSTTNAGGGGGGGAYVEMKFRASDLATTIAVTVAAAVLGGVGASNGNTGNNSTFGSLVTAYGGGPGLGTNANTGVAGGGGGGGLSVGVVGSGSTGGSGGGPQGGASTIDSSIGGGGGNAGRSAWGGGGGGIGGNIGQSGGNTMFGGGGGGGATSNNGNSAGNGGTSLYGGTGGIGGGSGSDSNGSDGVAPAGGGGGGGVASGGIAKNGGGGARGEVRVWTFL